jgi:hypothetical protein
VLALKEDMMPHIFSDSAELLQSSCEQVRDLLLDAWKWDVDYSSTHAEVIFNTLLGFCRRFDLLSSEAGRPFS